MMTPIVTINTECLLRSYIYMLVYLFFNNRLVDSDQFIYSVLFVLMQYHIISYCCCTVCGLRGLRGLRGPFQVLHTM